MYTLKKFLSRSLSVSPSALTPSVAPRAQFLALSRRRNGVWKPQPLGPTTTKQLLHEHLHGGPWTLEQWFVNDWYVCVRVHVCVCMWEWEWVYVVRVHVPVCVNVRVRVRVRVRVCVRVRVHVCVRACVCVRGRERERERERMRERKRERTCVCACVCRVCVPLSRVAV